MNIINVLEQEQLRTDIPTFRAGDTVRVHVKVVEGSRERIQVFEGLVIKRQNGGVRETFTVRRIASGVGVERTFPLHSPRLAKIEVMRRGVVRRAKLYYLRNLTGKAARIRENDSNVHKKAAVGSLLFLLKFRYERKYYGRFTYRTLVPWTYGESHTYDYGVYQKGRRRYRVIRCTYSSF